MTIKNTTSRRGTMQLSLAALFAGLAAPALAAGSSETPDPLLELYREWRALEDVYVPMEKRHDALRKMLVGRYGEPIEFGGRASDLWGHDPDYPELGPLGEELESLVNEQCEIIDEMMEIPATTLAGMHAKLRVTASNQPSLESENSDLSWHEEQTVKFLRDALRFLGEPAI